MTDQVRITVRSGPSTGNKVIATAQTGDMMILLGSKPDGWSLVRLSGGKEGWVLTRFLVKERPAKLRLAELDPANKDQARRLEQMHKENQSLSKNLSETEAKLAELQTRYDKLSADAADVMALKARHQKLQAQFDKQSAQNTELVVENKSLKFSSNLKWFLAGAGVLIVGWLMGLALHRRKKRWNSSMY
ncbi:MAG: TIGR04211 family SH3 domain-containing protein [Desulfarculaceae bacterium]|nr:TIGR04211 family SH3 domain-containing protein [Desulfarculaceae bacterium]MCF8049199.1 TIGR04211 family SH3 domain-containing protein [Desulfarculaceae bacterium]MCF8065837.1 TIGR04211 family SH3 domain-containing protein [Desulfarculaceae bacterium]MCF8096246.1 TIGR04211 family SH3 domain-containing protein [Desulfarculaceae bacterium]MCF8123592.1 TIGR04211 family SH3 domain-containing protein [Desulfarculaceae bacterium]